MKLPVKRILVVDDHAESLRMAETALRAAGYDVATADQADAAVQRIRQGRPDLVLIDLHMPGVDGLDLGAVLQVMHQRDRIPMILYSSAASPPMIYLKSGGFLGFLQKPLDTRALRFSIERLAAAAL